MPLQVVRKHTKKNMCAEPVIEEMVNDPDMQVHRLERSEHTFYLRQTFVCRYGLYR